MRTLDQANLSAADRAAVEEAAAILRRDFPVEHVTLFGSRARGHGDAESDIDLLVLLSGPVTYETESQIQQALHALETERHVVFGLLILSREEWETGRWQVLPIHREVERDGVAA
jgi:predicted nucleotidyltransferase